MLTLNATPKISIIVPVFNAEKSINKCADSIFKQTFLDYEIIFVNDGSTDETRSLLSQLQAQDGRIKVISQDNKGTGEARNTGIKHAKGEFVCFMDSDDTAEPNMLACLFAQIGQDIDIVICGFNEVSESGKVRKHNLTSLLNIEEYFKSILSFKNASAVWAKLFRTRLFENKACLFPAGLRNNEDNATLYKLLYFAIKVSFVSETLYNWNRGTDTKSRNINRLRIKETIDVLHQRKVFLQSQNIFKCNIEDYYSGVIYTLNLRKIQIYNWTNSIEQAELIKCLNVCILKSNLIDKKEILLIRQRNIFDYWRLLFFASDQIDDKTLREYQQYFDKGDWGFAVKCAQVNGTPEIYSLKSHLTPFVNKPIYIYGVGQSWQDLQAVTSFKLDIKGYIDQSFKGKSIDDCYDLDLALHLIPPNSVIIIASVDQAQKIVTQLKNHQSFKKKQFVLVTFAGVLID